MAERSRPSPREDLLSAGIISRHPQPAAGTGLGEVLQHHQGGHPRGAAAGQKLLEEDEESGGDEQWEAALGPEPGSASCWAQPTADIPEPPEEAEEEEDEWNDEDPDGIHTMVSGEGRGWTMQGTAWAGG